MAVRGTAVKVDESTISALSIAAAVGRVGEVTELTMWAVEAVSHAAVSALTDDDVQTLGYQQH